MRVEARWMERFRVAAVMVRMKPAPSWSCDAIVRK
jgi:hypothetical protein